MFAQIVKQHRLGVTHVCILPVHVILLDLLKVGSNGIDVEAGYTTPDIEEARIKETAVNTSYMAFVLADHTKFRRVFPVTFSPIQKCCIITDKLRDNSFANETVIKEVLK